MPRRKKFVDRNAPNAFTFRLVHRSQRDLRAADPEASPYVLVPVRHTREGGWRPQPELELDMDELFVPQAAKARAAAAAAARAAAQPQDEQKKQLLRYGIYLDDGYDYLQHMRAPSNLPQEQVAAAAQMVAPGRRDMLLKLGLPAEVFPSAREEAVGLLNRAAPNSDPRVDWDPDLVEILDDEEIDPELLVEDAELGIRKLDGGLPDDFILLASSDDPNAGAEAEEAEEAEDDWEDIGDEEEEAGEAGEEQRWRRIGHGARLTTLEAAKAAAAANGLTRARRQKKTNAEEEAEGEKEGGDAGDDDDTLEADSQAAAGDFSEVRSRFTEYSMSSSILPRSEHLQRQDDHFEEFYAKYDEEKLGALDDDVDDPELVGEMDISQFANVMKDFLRVDSRRREKYVMPQDPELLQKTKELAMQESKEAPAQRAAAASAGDDEEAGAASTAGDPRLVAEYPDRPVAKWDCASVLSTRSTLYNHPTVIDEPARPRKIVLDERTGIPLEGLERRDKKKEQQQQEVEGEEEDDGNDSDVQSSTRESNAGLFNRPKEETPEERKARKKAVREMRRERREEKKATKVAYKKEEQRQLKNALHQQRVKVLS